MTAGSPLVPPEGVCWIGWEQRELKDASEAKRV